MFKGRDILSILDFKRNEIEHIFEITNEMKKILEKGKSNILEGKILATAFFEPSTRTKLSFETAMQRLGGSVIGFSEPSTSSIAKGENISDTIRMLDSYADIIVIRHRLEGVAKLAAEIANSPVINGGDGTHNHPTQSIIDLYTIWDKFGKIDGLNICILGDLKYGRAAISFIYGLTLFNPKKVFLVSPSLLKIRQEVRDFLKSVGLNIYETESLEEVLSNCDVLYVTRIQKERFPDPTEYEKVKGSYRISIEMLKNAKENLIILHPLPRIDEIDMNVDYTKYAYYFKQAANGIPVRMSLLALLLGAFE
jgi:aspartate carbamoyltransferase catalytic subunit